MYGQNLRDLIQSHGPHAFYQKLCSLLNEQKISPNDISYYELAQACNVLPKLRSLPSTPHSEQLLSSLLHESSPGVNTTLFQVVTAELIGRKVIEGYNDETGFIGDQLVTVIPSSTRNQKLAGFRALAGPTEVTEGHPYEESSFAEKFVTSSESKQGRILSINEELIAFDQSGEINRRAMALGFFLRQERERTIIRAVTDADAAAGQFVYRPGGQGTTLYNTSGVNQNYIGTGNTTAPAFDQPRPLVNHTDVEHALHFRATQVFDDRLDGPPRPIVAPARQLLVSEKLRGTAASIANATQVTKTTSSGDTTLANPIAGQFTVLSSPFVDELGPSEADNWYVGDFQRQFVWTEIWPVQTFLQRSDSEAAFERDVVLRVKARYFGGLSAVDSRFVTKVDGTAS